MSRFFWTGTTPPGLAAAGSGTIDGSTGGTDNRALRSDGAGGTTLQASPVSLDDTGALSGNLLGRRAGVGGVTLAAADSGKVLTIDSGGGADSITLPAAPNFGVWYIFYILSADEVTVQAQGSHVIRTGAAASSAGGTAKSSTIGSSLFVHYAATNQWAAVASGTWAFA